MRRALDRYFAGKSLCTTYCHGECKTRAAVSGRNSHRVTDFLGEGKFVVDRGDVVQAGEQSDWVKRGVVLAESKSLNVNRHGGFSLRYHDARVFAQRSCFQSYEAPGSCTELSSDWRSSLPVSNCACASTTVFLISRRKGVAMVRKKLLGSHRLHRDTDALLLSGF